METEERTTNQCRCQTYPKNPLGGHEQRQPPNYGDPDQAVRPPASGYPARPDYLPPGYGYGTDFEAPYGP